MYEAVSVRGDPINGERSGSYTTILEATQTAGVPLAAHASGIGLRLAGAHRSIDRFRLSFAYTTCLDSFV
jgi:hypothetical protein